MNELSVPSLIEETRNLWNQGRKVMIQVAYNLYRIRNSDGWSGYDTFPKFCEQELDIGQSQTSKLLTIADFYLDKYSPEQIGPVAYENLYASAKLGGDPEIALARAKTWSRDDFKKEKAEVQPHEGEWITYCKICELSQANHP